MVIKIQMLLLILQPVNYLAKEIINTVNGKAEYKDYDCDDQDVGNGKMWLFLDFKDEKINFRVEQLERKNSSLV